MFKIIRLLSLRNGEFLQFISDIIVRCKRFDIGALHIAKRVRELEREILKLGKVFNKKSGSRITDLLVDLDHKRDNAITGIKLSCLALVYHFETDTADAAKLISKSINKYEGNIARMNYMAETAVINALILKWEKSKEMTAALAKLHLSSWVAELKLLNTLFSKTFQDRVDDKLKSAGDSFSQMKPEVIQCYNKLCDVINAYLVIDENQEYKRLMDTINLIIEDYKAILAKRERKDIVKELEDEHKSGASHDEGEE